MRPHGQCGKTIFCTEHWNHNLKQCDLEWGVGGGGLGRERLQEERGGGAGNFLHICLDNGMGGAIVWLIRGPEPLTWTGNPAPSPTWHVIVGKLYSPVSDCSSVK